jgi:hypothetical protein
MSVNPKSTALDQQILAQSGLQTFLNGNNANPTNPGEQLNNQM